ncbi:MAG: FAD-binding oxidoreductase [Faecousia sp.]
MAGYNLNTLDPAAFAALLANREKEIASAGETLPAEEPPANRLAKQLHPRRQYFRVSEIVEHSKHCKSYILTPDVQRGTTACAYFSAGQYLSVFVNINGSSYNRPYSLVSSPRASLEGKYQLTVKEAKGGLVSSYILHNWHIGTSVETSDPMGTFTYEPLRDAPHVLGIAGGSGITPFMSLARAIAEGEEDCSLTLLYGSTTAAEILFREELESLAAACPKLKVVHILSDETAEGFAHGYITAERIKENLPSSPCSIFICGPKQMVSFVDQALSTLELEQKYIRHELHGEPFSPAEQSDSPCRAPVRVKLTVRRENRETVVFGSSQDTILRILENNGIAPPSRCRSGECGFCRSLLIEGDVYIPRSMDKRRQADSRYGYIHPCCTYPLGDLTLAISADR